MIQHPEQTYLSTCPVCTKQIDVTSLEPFTKLKCPFCGSMVRVRRKFDHFVIIRQIGEGGMSRVFEAEDETLGRRVALKILNRNYGRDAARVEQFRQEALITANVNHLNVIKLYSVGYDQGYFYIAMELVGGGSLEQRIRREGTMKEKEALRIGREIAEGLRAAQQLGLIHRDVKPANVLFTETGTAKVVDFGLALFVERGPDSSGEIWATPYYVAPEKVIDNREDYRSDIFSLGAALYHALTGRPPHKAETNSLHELRMIKCRRVSLEESGLRFGPRTVHVVNRMLAFNPEERCANYDEAVEELRLAEGLVGQSFFRSTSRRARWIAGTAAALVLAFAVGWLARTSGEKRAVSITEIRETGSKELSGEGVTLQAGQKNVAERFLNARKTMLKEQFSEARHDFESLIRSGDARQPTLNWARFNAGLCSLILGKKEAAINHFKDMADPATATGGIISPALSEFFKTLGNRLGDNLSLGIPVNTLGYRTDDEQLLGYFAHGLAEWHFGNPIAGAQELQFFTEKVNQLSSSPLNGTAAEWVPLYATLLEDYRKDMTLTKSLVARPQPVTLQECQATLASLRSIRSELKTEGRWRNTLSEWEGAIRRQLSQFKFDQQRRDLTAARTLRQRELIQLEDQTAALPALVSGYDFSRAIDSLRDMRFESPEVQAALEGKRYLYDQAQTFLNQLFRDISAKGYKGTVTRREGAPLEGQVTAGDLSNLTVTLDRGALTIPLDTVTPDCLIDMAIAFNNQITDSTDYYRRQEMIAVFARVSGLQTLSLTVAAQLMEENRDFRTRWMKVTQ